MGMPLLTTSGKSFARRPRDRATIYQFHFSMPSPALLLFLYFCAPPRRWHSRRRQQAWRTAILQLLTEVHAVSDFCIVRDDFDCAADGAGLLAPDHADFLFEHMRKAIPLRLT